MTFDECIRKGLIRKDDEAPGRVAGSIKSAERFLVEAEGNLRMGYNEGAELLAYNSAFQCGRALLFSKGYTERSHTCLIQALETLYKEDTQLKTMLVTFDQFRISRHNVQYDGDLVEPETAGMFVRFSSKFLAFVKKSLL
jgi:uncharacterized protein (UPF0332 family)